MAKKRDWRASGMTTRWKVSLPKRGERTHQGLSWGRILSPVSFLILFLWLSATWAEVWASELLAGPTAEIRSYYELDDLQVDWKLSPGLEAGIETLGPITWEWAMDLPENCPARVVARIRSADEAMAAEYLVSGKTRVHRAGLRAVRSLRKGAILTASDVELVADWVAPSTRTAESTQEIVGYYVAAPVAKGAYFLRTDLREAPLVRKNGEFRIEYHGSGLTVSGRGTTRRDAWLGEVINVRVIGAGKDCRGTVAGPNLVVVERRR